MRPAPPGKLWLVMRQRCTSRVPSGAPPATVRCHLTLAHGSARMCEITSVSRMGGASRTATCCARIPWGNSGKVKPIPKQIPAMGQLHRMFGCADLSSWRRHTEFRTFPFFFLACAFRVPRNAPEAVCIEGHKPPTDFHCIVTISISHLAIGEVEACCATCVAPACGMLSAGRQEGFFRHSMGFLC